MEQNQKMVKNLGTQEFDMEALPYALVGGVWMGSFEVGIDGAAVQAVLNHIVPAGQQLKMTKLHIWTQSEDGVKFIIVQTDPGTGEAGNPLLGSVPTGVREYPMLEAAGAETQRGSLIAPVSVYEGSIEFRIMGPVAASGDRYCLVWEGVEKVPQ